MRVHAIQTGTVAVKQRQVSGKGRGRSRLIRTMLDRTWTEALPIYAWAIEHPEGTIIVDTGETARAAEPGYFPRWHPYFRSSMRAWVAPDEEIGPQLRLLGIDPIDVRLVVLTHLHTDHAGGLGHFPTADVIVSRGEFAAASGMRGKVNGYLPHRWPHWFSPRLVDVEGEPLGPFPATVSLTRAGDVRLVATPGHTEGHCSVVLEGEDGYVFFAGDTSYTEALMLHQEVDGVAPDVRAASATLMRIRRFVDEHPVVYLPSHDPDAAARLANGLLAAGTASTSNAA